MRFTTAQNEVIQARGGNLVVSAAAGSGKTAVLTERILQRILQDRVDITRLLVVTFTRAAAAEMRERILSAINERLLEDPGNEHLQRQSILIHHAKITTIDSFCSFLLKEHFREAGLDPSTVVGQEAELAALKQDVLEEVLEESFKAASPEFLALADSFGKNVASDALSSAILGLSEFADSHPDPEGWLTRCAGGEAWKSYLAEEVKEQLSGLGELLGAARELAEAPAGPWFYLDLLSAEEEKLQALKQTARFSHEGGEGDFFCWYERVREAISAMEFGHLPSKKDDSVSKYLRDQAKELRNRVKEGLARLRERIFFRSAEEAMALEEKCSEELRTFIGLTLAFRERLQEKKRERKRMDFSDLEHMAYRVLVQDGRPTEVAKAYQEHFEEIYIDEYQDSNLLQEGILKAVSREESACPNRFLVGDVKQSIYRFRQARPELIMEKLERYGEGEGPLRRIDLDQNFRSREEVLEFTNFCFSQLMGKAVGGVEYDERASLKKGFPYEPGTDYLPELILLTPPKEEEQEENKETPSGNQDPEAFAVGERILSLVGKLKIFDKEEGSYRPARFKDCAILLRSLKGAGESFQRTLQEMGIPAYVTSRTGYFSATEVQTLLQALRVFHNPLEDIPLFGLMRSVFGGFSDEELALIRIKAASPNRENPPEEEKGQSTLYGDLLKHLSGEASEELPEELQEKLSSFLAWIRRYREKAAYTPVRSLIRELIYEEGYLNYVSAMPGGEKRRANVELLLSRAASFEESGILSLHRFVRYLERLEKLQIDYGEALSADEHADVVRIMSIHASKGLEFPICFVCRLDKRFNRLDETKRIAADMELGAAMDLIDEERIRRRSLKKRVVNAKIAREALGEELRILYVAFTRAREKLILSGNLKAPEKTFAAHAALSRRRTPLLPPTELLSAGSFLELIVMAAIRNQAADPLLPEEGEERKRGALYGKEVLKLILRTEQTGSALKERAYSLGEKRERLLHPPLPDSPEKRKELEGLKERFLWRYPYGYLSGLYTKTTVSRLKLAAMEKEVLNIEEEGASLEEEAESPGGAHRAEEILPRFMQKTESDAAFRGSAYHRALELLELGASYDPETLDAALDRLTASGRLHPEERALLRPERLLTFLRSPLAGRMSAAGRAGKLFREKPFVIGIPASEQDPAFPSEELVLIQGIIDVYFEEEGELVVMDYKTDRVSLEEELVRRYKTQLDYYARALRQLTGKKVKEKLIYSFALEKEVKLC